MEQRGKALCLVERNVVEERQEMHRNMGELQIMKKSRTGPREHPPETNRSERKICSFSREHWFMERKGDCFRSKLPGSACQARIAFCEGGREPSPDNKY